MIALLLGALAVCLVVMVASGVGRPSLAPAPRPPLNDSDDPVEMLERYGTSDDAARLIADGHAEDLAGLGYHSGEQ